jgi:hypothetical protein
MIGRVVGTSSCIAIGPFAFCLLSFRLFVSDICASLYLGVWVFAVCCLLSIRFVHGIFFSSSGCILPVLFIQRLSRGLGVLVGIGGIVGVSMVIF